MLDLDKFQTDTHTFNLVLPTGEISDIKVTVRSDSHPKVKEIQRKLFLESEQRRAIQKKRGKKDGDALTDDDFDYMEEAGLKRAMSRVEKIGGAKEDGKEIGDNQELIATVLKKYDWIVDQIGVAASDGSNFCRK